MSAIDDLFRQLRSNGRKAFMPFVTAGDPDLDFTAAIIEELVRRGSHLCELGIPYSDPIADGPVIQASYTRALERGVKLRDILAMLGETAHSAPALRVVVSPPSMVAPAQSRRGTFRPGAGWPGVAVARTGT